MAKPVIGVVTLIDEERESYWMIPGYMKGIEEAGGIPVMLPVTEDPEVIGQLAAELDGFLFTGGQDVNPALYGQEPVNSSVEPNAQRDGMEKILFNAAKELDKPILGICRGIQFINVLYGGTLWQDLPTQRGSQVGHHQSPPYDIPIHSVRVDIESPLYELLFDLLDDDSLRVNSLHHQAVREKGNGLDVMAISQDGLIEGLCDPQMKFMWTLQWHPELSFRVDEASRRIFKKFVLACRDRA